MANEKWLIDANAFLDRIKERHDDITQDPIVDKATKWRESVCFGGVVNELVKMPTVDAVEVRCEKCKHYQQYHKGKTNELCEWGKCKLISMDIDMPCNGFCCFGERRSE